VRRHKKEIQVALLKFKIEPMKPSMKKVRVPYTY
jgi:hypothetical protein